MSPVATYKTLLTSQIVLLRLEALVVVGPTPEGSTRFALAPVGCDHYSW
jgi:hypothetical protein